MYIRVRISVSHEAEEALAELAGCDDGVEILSRQGGLFDDCLSARQVVIMLSVGSTPQETEHFVRCAVCRQLFSDAGKAAEPGGVPVAPVRYGPGSAKLIDGDAGVLKPGKRRIYNRARGAVMLHAAADPPSLPWFPHAMLPNECARGPETRLRD